MRKGRSRDQFLRGYNSGTFELFKQMYRIVSRPSWLRSVLGKYIQEALNLYDFIAMAKHEITGEVCREKGGKISHKYTQYLRSY